MARPSSLLAGTQQKAAHTIYQQGDLQSSQEAHTPLAADTAL